MLHVCATGNATASRRAAAETRAAPALSIEGRLCGARTSGDRPFASQPAQRVVSSIEVVASQFAEMSESGGAAASGTDARAAGADECEAKAHAAEEVAANGASAAVDGAIGAVACELPRVDDSLLRVYGEWPADASSSAGEGSAASHTLSLELPHLPGATIPPPRGARDVASPRRAGKGRARSARAGANGSGQRCVAFGRQGVAGQSNRRPLSSRAGATPTEPRDEKCGIGRSANIGARVNCASAGLASRRPESTV